MHTLITTTTNTFVSQCHSSQSVADARHHVNTSVSAHVKQKREYSQSTKVTPDRGTRRQISQQSAASVDDDVDAAVAAASDSVGEGG